MIIALLATLFSSFASLLLAGVFVLQKHIRHRFSLELSSLAAGVLLSTAILHLIPEALEEGLAEQAMAWSVLLAILVFFVLERLVLWFHHHHEVEGPRPSAWLITLGDGLHNFVDGLAIAAAFQVEFSLGVFTALAVAAHELPHEMADFIVLLRSGLTNQRALLLNLLSASTALLGVVLGWTLGGQFADVLPPILAASGGMFLYIALSDIIPELHSHEKARPWTQIVCFVTGIGITQLLGLFLHV